MTALRSFFSARISSCSDSNPRTSSSVYSYVLTRLSSSKRVDILTRTLADSGPFRTSASFSPRHDDQRARLDGRNRGPQFRKQRAQVRQPVVARGDDDHADRKFAEILLVLKSLIRGNQHGKRRRCAREQFTVVNGGPAFFLHGTNLEFRQIAPDVPRHVLGEEHASH